MKKIIPGQVWSYYSRESEPSSTVTVIAVDYGEAGSNTIHVKIEGLNLINSKGSHIGDVVEHLPIDQEMFLKSVIKVIDETSINISEGYYYWKSEFENNNAGVWNIELIDVINSIESSIN